MSETTISYSKRMENLDALRGFALFGIFIVHMPELFELWWAHPSSDPNELFWHELIFTLFGGKAFAMLALTFGVSFFIIMDRAAKKGQNFTIRFIWRLIVLGLIGMCHCLIYRGDILEVLALMGLFVIPFYFVKSVPLLLAIGIFMLLQPYMFIQMFSGLQGQTWANQPFGYWSGSMPDVYTNNGTLLATVQANWTEGRSFKWLFMFESGRMSQIAGLSVIGLVLGKIGFFSEPEKYRKLRQIGVLVSAFACLILYFGLNMTDGALVNFVPATSEMIMPRTLWNSILSGWFNVSLMSFWVLSFITLYHGIAQRYLNLLAPVGRMTLTLYLLQSLIFVPVFYSFGLNLHATMSQPVAVSLAIVFFALQIVAAHVWFRHFYYGPMEWLWRAATYRTMKVQFVK